MLPNYPLILSVVQDSDYDILWTIVAVLAIIALIMFILGRR